MLIHLTYTCSISDNDLNFKPLPEKQRHRGAVEPPRPASTRRRATPSRSPWGSKSCRRTYAWSAVAQGATPVKGVKLGS